MSRVPIVVLLALTLVMAVGAQVLAEERTPPGSFLVYRAVTIKQLCGQVASSSLVRSRYASHFGVPASQLAKYFTENLTLVSVKSPIRTQSWYIDKQGNMSVKGKLLPRGTMVFATKDGEPLLAWSCGNPLRASLPSTVAKTKTSGTAQIAVLPKKLPPVAPPPVETKVLANPVETITAEAVTAVPAPAVVAAVPVEAPPALAVAAAPAVAVPPIMVAGSSFPFAALLPLAGLAAIPHNHPNPPPVVPEPTSLMTLVAGLSMAPVAYYFRRSRARR